MKTFAKATVVGVAALALLQFVRPPIPARPATAEIQVPTDVQRILEKSCYSCHSDQRRLSWFDQPVPAYWLVRRDILTAREHLNFSTLGSKPPAAQKAVLYEAVNMVQLGAMPLPSFLKLHPEARVTPEELATLKAFLAPWASAPNPHTGATMAGNVQSPVSLAAVSPELDGFPFDPDFENWKPVSFTDRGDNNTFRFVLGNEIAVKAAQSGHISPWPDGSRFAKIAWQQEQRSDGLIYPGEFIQVELMVKDAQRYQKTDGWGWGRWRGIDLKPYGNDARFVNECTGCHMPVRGNDYVYTLPMTMARVPGEELVNNQAASLPASLPYQASDWRAITMYVDPNARTMSSLYGNDTAMRSVDPRGGAAEVPTYKPGSVLALVTWAQREDPHWFGGRIPAIPKSVEFVEVATAGEANQYRRFAGGGMAETHMTPEDQAKRRDFILHLAPARLP